MHVPPNIGPLIRAAREAAGVTRTELAYKVGRTEQTISCWETGRFRPSPAQVGKVARILGITVAELLDSEAVA